MITKYYSSCSAFSTNYVPRTAFSRMRNRMAEAQKCDSQRMLQMLQRKAIKSAEPIIWK